MLRDSESVVFSTSSYSLRFCAIRAVDAIVSVSEGWSHHNTLSVTSPSPRSMRDALAAHRDLTGLSLNEPFDEVTDWRNNWYCAKDTFQLDPSSSSPSERDLSLLVSAMSGAAQKFTEEPSLRGDSDDEDLLTGDLERVELLDSSTSLCLLTRVLDLLARVWESLVLDDEGHLLKTFPSTGGLSWLSGTGINVSMHLCIKVINDMKSRRLVWLIRLGSDGKIRLPSSEAITESCPCWPGVWDLAGVVPAGGLSCWVGAPCLVRSCRVFTFCRVGIACRVVIFCRVGITCRVFVFCRHMDLSRQPLPDLSHLLSHHLLLDELVTE